ncbi:hypothetical protein MP228_008892 [Amoeboaphelidium protococcarum]|nr:hypothetical protein MP228_008892 [Amoeboaphelidium protococcarum]
MKFCVLFAVVLSVSLSADAFSIFPSKFKEPQARSKWYVDVPTSSLLNDNIVFDSKWMNGKGSDVLASELCELQLLKFTPRFIGKRYVVFKHLPCPSEQSGQLTISADDISSIQGGYYKLRLKLGKRTVGDSSLFEIVELGSTDQKIKVQLNDIRSFRSVQSPVNAYEYFVRVNGRSKISGINSRLVDLDSGMELPPSSCQIINHDASAQSSVFRCTADAPVDHKVYVQVYKHRWFVSPQVLYNSQILLPPQSSTVQEAEETYVHPDLADIPDEVGEEEFWRNVDANRKNAFGDEKFDSNVDWSQDGLPFDHFDSHVDWSQDGLPAISESYDGSATTIAPKPSFKPHTDFMRKFRPQQPGSNELNAVLGNEFWLKANDEN